MESAFEINKHYKQVSELIIQHCQEELKGTLHNGEKQCDSCLVFWTQNIKCCHLLPGRLTTEEKPSTHYSSVHNSILMFTPFCTDKKNRRICSLQPNYKLDLCKYGCNRTAVLICRLIAG